MATKKLFTTLTLLVLTVISSNMTVMGQQIGRPGGRYFRATAKRNAAYRRVPSKLKVPPRRAPSTNERPKRTEDERKFAAAASMMARYKQWMIGANKKGFVYPNLSSGPAYKKYNLKGTVITKFLHYESQGTFGGINLGWTKTASEGTAIDRAQWFFQRPGGPNQQLSPVVYGEPLALGWGRGGKPFLKYSKRRVGINLNWSGPSFEWTILGRKPGERVRRGQDLVILYNLKHKLPLMYFDRTKGGDIGWPDSTRWAQATIKDPRGMAALAKAAQVMMGK